MRILVTGSKGQVVSALKACADEEGIEIVTLARPEVDLTHPESLSAPIRAARADAIISAAAYTQVDQAESEPEKALMINAHAPAALARLAAELDVPLLHLSTDYVFDGRTATAYVETDATGPLNVYGRTKLEGERLVARHTDNHVILRTSGVYSAYGLNFVKTMRELAKTREVVRVVSDQYTCPTYAPDIAHGLLHIARRLRTDSDPALRGVFHFAGQSPASWAELARAALNGTGVQVEPVLSTEYPSSAQRPANSCLNCDKLHALYGVRLSGWHTAIEQCRAALQDGPTGGT